MMFDLMQHEQGEASGSVNPTVSASSHGEGTTEKKSSDEKGEAFVKQHMLLALPEYNP
jgi:hypothetical protein